MLCPSILRTSLFACIIRNAHTFCYFPDGKTIASGFSPCENTSGNSTCCQRGFACMSNNLCELTPYASAGPGQTTYVRGSCTDPSWNDPSCPSFCISPENKDTWNAGMGLDQCPDSSLDAYYCVDAATESLSPEQACANDAVTFPGKYLHKTRVEILTLGRNPNDYDHHWDYNIEIIIDDNTDRFIDLVKTNHSRCVTTIIRTAVDFNVVIISSEPDCVAEP